MRTVFGIKEIAACALITSFFALLVYPVFNLPFAVGDDHRIIAMNHPEKMENAYINTLHGYDPGLNGTLLNDAKLGRFRPLGWTFTKLQCLVYGDNSFAWRITNVFILLFSLLSFAAICTRMKIGFVPVAAMLCVYAFGKNNETWWTLIPPAQNMGELFLLTGFLCWIIFRQEGKKNYKIIALILFFASAMIKESYIFCIPFVWLADFFFFSPEKNLFTKNYLLLWLTFLIPFFSLAFTIIFSKTVYSYAYPDSLLSILTYNTKEFFIASVFLIAPVIMFLKRDYVISRRNLLKLLMFTFSWLVVQLILLKGIKMNDQHHYLVPGLLPILLLSAMSLHYLKLKSRKIYSSLFAIYLVFALWNAKNTFVNAGFYSAQVKSYYSMVDAIKEYNPKNIFYMSPTPVAGDWLMGTSAILRNEGVVAPLVFCTWRETLAPWEKKFMATRPPLQFPWAEFKTVIVESGDLLLSVESQEGMEIPPSAEQKALIAQTFVSEYTDIRLRDLPDIVTNKFFKYEIYPIGYGKK